jgi:hypothetical protein
MPLVSARRHEYSRGVSSLLKRRLNLLPLLFLVNTLHIRPLPTLVCVLRALGHVALMTAVKFLSFVFSTLMSY